ARRARRATAWSACSRARSTSGSGWRCGAPGRTTRAYFVSWGTNEAQGRARGGLRAAHLPLQGDQPDRRGLHAALRPRGDARTGGPSPALRDARRAVVVPSAAPELERFGGARQPGLGGMVGRPAAARGTRPDVRVLRQRAGAAPAAARRSPRGAFRFLWGNFIPPGRRGA